MKLPTLIAIAAFFVSSHVFALDNITNAKQPSEQDIALAEQDAGTGFFCIQSGSSDTFICQKKDHATEVVVNRPLIGCEPQQVAQGNKFVSALKL